jgi:hypothetical protein
MGTPRVEIAFAEHGGSIYAMGGRTSVDFANAAAEKLAP